MRTAPCIALMALAALGGCQRAAPPTTENAAKALDADLVNRAAVLDANVNAEANTAAAAAMAEANVAQATFANSASAVVNRQ